METTDIVEKFEVCSVEILNSERKEYLISKGFRFHDRVFCMEIDLRKKKFKPLEAAVSGICFRTDNEYNADIYNLAHIAYTTDRRFHLPVIFNMEEAIPIYRYMMREESEGFEKYLGRVI